MTSALLCGSAVLLGMIGTAAVAQAAPATPAAASAATLFDGQVGTFATAVDRAVQQKAAENPGTAILTITYNDDRAPDYQGVIAEAAAAWNTAVSTVTITRVATAGTDLAFVQYDSSVDPDPGEAPDALLALPIDITEPLYASARTHAWLFGALLGLEPAEDGDCSSVMYLDPACTEIQPSAAETATAAEKIATNSTLIEEFRADPPGTDE